MRYSQSGPACRSVTFYSLSCRLGSNLCTPNDGLDGSNPCAFTRTISLGNQPTGLRQCYEALAGRRLPPFSASAEPGSIKRQGVVKPRGALDMFCRDKIRRRPGQAVGPCRSHTSMVQSCGARMAALSHTCTVCKNATGDLHGFVLAASEHGEATYRFLSRPARLAEPLTSFAKLKSTPPPPRCSTCACPPIARWPVVYPSYLTAGRDLGVVQDPTAPPSIWTSAVESVLRKL